MEETNNTFQYSYSAKQREEILRIRKKYAVPEDDKMSRLRKLDRRASGKAQSSALTLGVIGLLLLGIGMSVTMTDLAALLNLNPMLVGIPVGLVGIVLVALAYPTYNRVLKRERQRVAPEILRLTDELLK